MVNKNENKMMKIQIPFGKNSPPKRSVVKSRFSSPPKRLVASPDKIEAESNVSSPKAFGAVEPENYDDYEEGMEDEDAES